MKLGLIEPKSLFDEFKRFAFKGNMIDLAVGVVIGAAFGGVINSFVKNIIMPVVSYIPGLKGKYEDWHIGQVKIGLFLGDVLNFVLVAAAVFLIIVKVIGGLQKLAHRKHDEESAEPTTKECPRCLSTIPLKATKCPQCTADLPETPEVSPA